MIAGDLQKLGTGIIFLADRVSLSFKEETMPTYEYLCSQCGHEFTRIMSFSEYEAGKVTCPKCNSAEVKQQMTAFISKTSRKS
jgi:putative FmdB family regulatory protein